MTQSNIDSQDPFTQALRTFQEEERKIRLNDDDQDKEQQLATMPLTDHLQELRVRLFILIAALVIGTIITFIFYKPIIQFLIMPLPETSNILNKDTGKQLVVTGLTEGFTTYLLIAFAGGIALALPVALHQVWAFVAPGLYEHEKRASLPFVFIGVGLFVLGVCIGFLMLRYPITWLVEFASQSFVPLVTAQSYLEFVTLFLLTFGLIFEMPLVLIFLARVGIVTEPMLKDKRATFHFAMWVAAAFITPGADLYSPMILGAIMSGLYELSIVLIRLFVKEDQAFFA